ncbi:MAG: secretin N-terminal domain-containing protein [Bryobacteraceae bacterium]|jgi:phosphotransferase system IIB component
MKRIAAVLMLATLSWAAQDNQNTQSKPPDVIVQRLFVLKYASPEQVMNLVTELAGRPARWSDQLRAIAVTAEKDAMAVIEDAIKQLDVPSAAPKNIELTVNLIVGTDSESSIGNPVPKEMESVVAQLKGAFPFKNYRQVDLIEMRTRTGEKVGTVSNGGTVNVTPGSGAVQTNAHIQAVGLAQDGSTVRLDNVALTIHWPGVETGLALQASVDVKEGQKAVLGRIGVAHDQALFVVLTAHVVQ